MQFFFSVYRKIQTQARLTVVFSRWLCDQYLWANQAGLDR